jgi:hypothetical protein
MELRTVMATTTVEFQVLGFYILASFALVYGMYLLRHGFLNCRAADTRENECDISQSSVINCLNSSMHSILYAPTSLQVHSLPVFELTDVFRDESTGEVALGNSFLSSGAIAGDFSMD